MRRHQARQGPGHPVGPAAHRGRSWRAAVCLLAVCLVAPVIVGTGTSGADDVDDLTARADEVAHRLMDLRGRMSVIGEQFNQSQVRREQLQATRADLAERARAAELQVAVRRADAARYALSAYMGVGESDALSLALDGRQWDLSRRAGYASISVGDRQQIVDDLQAAQRVGDELTAAIDDAEAAEREVTADLERQQAEATRLLAEQEALQDSVQGELAEAVQRRQAELAAQAERAAAARQAAAETATTDATAHDGTAADSTADSAQTPSGSGSDVDAAGSASGPDRGSGVGTSPATRPGASPTSRPSTSPSTPPPATAPPATAPPVTNPPPPPVVPPASGGGRQAVADAAISQLGVAYSWGGGNASGPSMGFGPGAGIVGFDCSGLTMYAWARVGVYLPHSAQMQYDMSAKVSLSQLQPGDLVFYGSSSRSIDHVSVYVGGGQVVHAPNSRSVVQYGPVQLWPGYYPWVGAGRPG